MTLTAERSREIYAVARAMRDYIDALPSEVVATLPAMPGFDRDWADDVIESASREMSSESAAIPDIGSVVVNKAAWKLHDMMTEHGPLNGRQFNNIKVCFYEALKICMGNEHSGREGQR